MTSMSKFMDRAAPLPIYTPAIGYTYQPPAPTKPNTQTAQSSFSREGSIGPNAQQSAASQRSTSLEPDTQSTTTASSDPRDAQLLDQSLRLMLAYGDEYMDENPLQGEPGNFVYTHTQKHLRAQQAASEALAQKAMSKEKEREEAAQKSKSTTPAAAAAAAVAVGSFTSTADKIKIEAGLGGDKPQPIRKASKNNDGKKRRKSKANVSPVSATMGSSPMATRSPSLS